MSHITYSPRLIYARCFRGGMMLCGTLWLTVLPLSALFTATHAQDTTPASVTEVLTNTPCDDPAFLKAVLRIANNSAKFRTLNVEVSALDDAKEDEQLDNDRRVENNFTLALNNNPEFKALLQHESDWYKAHPNQSYDNPDDRAKLAKLNAPPSRSCSADTVANADVGRIRYYLEERHGQVAVHVLLNKLN